MRDLRTGECLWMEWVDEEGFSSSLTFFTHGHVDVENEIVRRALASALQREGSVSSLFAGFDAIEKGDVSFGYAGYVDSDIDLETCNEFGETQYGDEVDEVLPVTWVSLRV